MDKNPIAATPDADSPNSELSGAQLLWKIFNTIIQKGKDEKPTIAETEHPTKEIEADKPEPPKTDTTGGGENSAPEGELPGLGKDDPQEAPPNADEIGDGPLSGAVGEEEVEDKSGEATNDPGDTNDPNGDDPGEKPEEDTQTPVDPAADNSSKPVKKQPDPGNIDYGPDGKPKGPNPDDTLPPDFGSTSGPGVTDPGPESDGSENPPAKPPSDPGNIDYGPDGKPAAPDPADTLPPNWGSPTGPGGMDDTPSSGAGSTIIFIGGISDGVGLGGGIKGISIHDILNIDINSIGGLEGIGGLGGTINPGLGVRTFGRSNRAAAMLSNELSRITDEAAVLLVPVGMDLALGDDVLTELREAISSNAAIIGVLLKAGRTLDDVLGIGLTVWGTTWVFVSDKPNV